MVRVTGVVFYFLLLCPNWNDVLLFLFQHQIIYYLCVLLKDPSEPDAVSSVVPLFQVRTNALFTHDVFD